MIAEEGRLTIAPPFLVLGLSLDLDFTSIISPLVAFFLRTSERDLALILSVLGKVSSFGSLCRSQVVFVTHLFPFQYLPVLGCLVPNFLFCLAIIN